MKQEIFNINSTPAVLYGEQSDKVYLFIHGQCGNKFEGERFAEIVVPKGWQVLAIDLPEHGGRTDGAKLLPWEVGPELKAVIAYINSHWKRKAVRATSIGAWFSMLSLIGKTTENCIFVSPVVDMVNLISNMMKMANVDEQRLQKDREIPTDFGQTLSWEYLCYAKEHQAVPFCDKTHILYGENDELVAQDVIKNFAEKHNCELTVMQNGEHWFHTDEQLKFMKKFEENSL